MGKVVWTRMAIATGGRRGTQRGRFSVEAVTATAGRAGYAQTGEAQAAARRRPDWRTRERAALVIFAAGPTVQ